MKKTNSKLLIEKANKLSKNEGMIRWRRELIKHFVLVITKNIEKKDYTMVLSGLRYNVVDFDPDSRAMAIDNFGS